MVLRREWMQKIILIGAGSISSIALPGISLAEIKQMVNRMFEQNKDYLPQFSHFKV
jgi:hypothetical protein